MKNLYREYFHIPKDKHMSTKVFMTNLVLAVVSIVGCTFALFATSYAWFSADVTSTGNMVASTFFNTYEESISETVTLDSEHIFTAQLAENYEHVFKLTSEGATTGYCIVTIEYKDDNQDYVETFYTDEIPAGGHLMLGIQAVEGAKITFKPYWGKPEYQNYSGTLYGETTRPQVRKLMLRRTNTSASVGDYIPGPVAPYLEYQFPQYASLEDVAEFYGIDMEDILIFNGIDDPAEIGIGDWIKLPYVDEDAEVYVAMPEDIEHIVQEGETLESIAELYDISIEELIAYNELQPYVEEEESAESTEGLENSETSEYVEGVETPEYIGGFDVIEEEPEPVYVLTPGEILLIPFYAETGYTSSDVVHEEDFVGQEPGYFGEGSEIQNSEGTDNEDTQDSEENKPIGGILRNDNEEDEQQEEEETTQSTPNVSGVLTLDGSSQTQQQEPETQTETVQTGVLTNDSTSQQQIPNTQTSPEQTGILTPGA